MTQQQALYYDHFRTRVVSQLCSQVPAGFWLRTILRECTLDEGILNCAVGIGALAYVDHARSRWNLPLLRRGDGGTETNHNDGQTRHYEVAIASYTKALAKFRHGMSSSTVAPPTARSILISSLLFLIFELLQGDMRAVDSLSASCFKVLKRDLLRSKAGRGSVIAAALDDEEVQDAEYLLIRLTALRGLTSPLCPAAEETARGFRLPVLFDLQIPDPSEPNIERFIMVWKRLWTLASLWNLQATRRWEVFSRVVSESTVVRPVQLTEQELGREKFLLLDLTERCRDVTLERLSNEKNPIGQRHLEYALALGKLHPIMLSASADLLDDPWDRNLDACLEVVELGWRFITETAASELSQSLIFDGPVPTLLQMIQGCRDLVLRQSAIELLGRLVTFKSSWEMRSLFMGTHGLVDLEERERTKNGEIAMTARYNWTHAAWSEDYKLFYCTYTAKMPEPDGHRREIQLILQFEDYGLA
ncbi:hypothetical protein HJFPF1_10516 [Paramyrothecium foliicola]|nr:hypothetical protein HJFPF1_10516 [Paramyrothecium foliicola]